MMARGKVGSPQLAQWLERGAIASPLFPRPIRVLALAAFLGVLFIYLGTVSQQYSADSMAFAMTVTYPDPNSRTFLQAEHLLFVPIGIAWYEWFQFLGYRGGALEPLQILSAVSGAAGVALFFLTLRLLLGKRPDATLISLLVALFVGTTHGYWFHSTEAEDQILANALLLGAVLCLVISSERLRDDFTWHQREVLVPGFLAMALVALAALVHGTAALFTPALLVALWLLRAPRSVLAGAVAGIPSVIMLVLIVVGSTGLGLRTPLDFSGWLLSAPGHGVWGRIGSRSVLQAAETWVSSIVYLQDGPEFRRLLRGDVQWRSAVSAVTFILVGLSIAGSLGYAWYNRKSGTRRWIGLFVLVWCGAYALFNVYWAPEDVQFWIAVIPPVAIAAALSFVALIGHWPRRTELLSSCFAFAIAAGFLINLATSAVPRSDLQNNVGLKKALCVGNNVREMDLIIGPGWDWSTSYIPYFTGRRAIGIVDLALLEAGRDRDRVSRLIEQHAKRVWSGGGHVFLVRVPTLNDDDRAWLERTAGFEPGRFPLPVARAFSCGDEIVWLVLPR